MQITSLGILYAATDLVNFLECERLTALDLLTNIQGTPSQYLHHVGNNSWRDEKIVRRHFNQNHHDNSNI